MNPDNYAQDIRPAGIVDYQWDFEVDTSFSGDVTLSWDIVEVPAEYGFVLLIDTMNTPGDTSDDVVTDMRAASSYVYNSAIAYVPRQLQFVVRTNNPPTVQVTSPGPGATVGGFVAVIADATPPAADEVWPYLDEVVSVAFEYSPDGGTTWSAIGTDNDGSDGWSCSLG